MRRLGVILVLVSCLGLAWALAACSGSATTTAPEGSGLSPTTSDASVPPVEGSEPPEYGDQPAPRVSPGLFYDPIRERVMLFGGGDEDSDYGDTWTYDTASNQWTKLAPGGEQPDGRSMFALAYDLDRRQALIFGGGGTEGPLNDTWVYDPAADLWTESAPTGDLPPERWASSAVYDPESGETLLFGGGGLDGMLNDTWAYDPESGAWRALDPPGGMPVPRGYLELVLDPESGKVVLFGGGTEEDDFKDTWAYDPALNTWTDLDPAGPVPEERSGYAMVYDSEAAVMILFGGMNAYDSFNDTWAYNPATNRWTELAPDGLVPDMRAFHAMVYDSDTGQVIMFGGFDGYQYLNDTWAYDRKTNTWTELMPATGEALQARTRVSPGS